MSSLIVDTDNEFSQSLKIGFNHTCDPSLNSLLLKLKPKVIRTYFDIKDIKKVYDLGSEPFVGVRFMPLELSLNGSKESPPKSYTLWAEYVSDVVSDILNAGMKPNYYSIWNEPERKETPIFWNGTIEDYVKLYEFASKAIKKVDPNCKVGGPETSSYNPLWIQTLLEESNKRRFDVDFISFHQFENPPNIITDSEKTKRRFYRLKKKEGKINISEWGFEIKNAHLITQHLAYAEKAGIDFYCKDFFFEKKWKCSVIDDEHKKRDMFYLLEVYSEFNQKRFNAFSDDTNLKVIAGPVNKELLVIFSSLGITKKVKPYNFLVKGGKFKPTSLYEISQNGLIEQKFKTAGNNLKLYIEYNKAYALRGEIKK